MVKVGKYEYQISSRPGKKLMVKVGNKRIHFGSFKNEHFRDKTGIWKSLDHNDKERRKRYLSRSSGIKNKSGELTKDDPMSANYHSRRVLW